MNLCLRRSILTLICVLFTASPAFADEVLRTVILKVPGANDGTAQLTAEIEAMPNLDIRDQRWFLTQVKERGMKAKKLLHRPADLRFVMSGSNIAYVIYVDDEEGGFEGQVFASDGLLVDSVQLGTEFGEVEAAEVRALFERVLGIEAEVVEAETPAPKEIVVTESEVDTTQSTESSEKSADSHQGGVSVHAAGRIFKRDLTYAGSNNAVLNYDSALYPGLGLDLGYGLDAVEIGPGILDVWLSVDLGFDSLATSEESFSILHLEGAGGVGLMFDAIGLRMGARHVRYSLKSNDVFPSIVHTLVVLGFHAEQKLGALVLGGEAEIHPWGFYNGSASRLFGGKSSQLGFAGGLTVGFAVGDALTIGAGYHARAERSSFPGQGSLDFTDSRGFELVHGPELGVTWHP